MIHCSLLSVRNCAWKGLIIIIWLVIKDHWKRLWSWEGLGAGGEGDDRRWDGWMASLNWCTWVWVNSENWWWTGRPGVLQSMGSLRVGHDWATEPPERKSGRGLWLFIAASSRPRTVPGTKMGVAKAAHFSPNVHGSFFLSIRVPVLPGPAVVPAIKGHL